MSWVTAIVLIVLIVSITQVIRSRHNAQAGFGTDEDGNPVARQRDEAEEARLRAEIAELKERVKVLERIATDERQKLGLAEEIELLRDR
ncbi:hypothetical protein [Croceicoccus sp. Ery5]|uniref:hypothetical protein n=1 Tax=Croceicoccus sp. Ery5 TaxID=1703340 RepID=UPI001E2A554A|nr:hypothetical protein [Croceicoccus sp. Ery5]